MFNGFFKGLSESKYCIGAASSFSKLNLTSTQLLFYNLSLPKTNPTSLSWDKVTVRKKSADWAKYDEGLSHKPATAAMKANQDHREKGWLKEL